MCVCVCVCARVRDHFNCFLIPAESTLNAYCLINNHRIKVCFYLCTHNENKKQNDFIYTVGTESIQTPLNFSLFVILQPFAKII